MIIDTRNTVGQNQARITNAIAKIAEVINEGENESNKRKKKKSVLTYYSAIMGIKPPRNNTNAATLSWISVNASEEKLNECRERIKQGISKNVVRYGKRLALKQPAESKHPKAKTTRITKSKAIKIENYQISQAWIYAIENTVNGKKYIGSTRNLVNRWEDHLKDLKKGKHHTKRLQEDWGKHKETDFHIKELHNVRAIGNYGLLELESYEIKKVVNERGRDAIYNTELDPLKRELTGSQTYIK